MCDDRAVVDPVLADPHAETLPSDPATARDREARDELIGRTLGHFRIDARLGRGGMGAVYRGWDASLEREVAVKVLLGASDASRERFLREARVQAKLRHPNVVPIHFVGQAEEERKSVSFLVMDVVDGESLADLLAREGSLSEARALDVADAIASALEAGSSAGLVHRDVKPSNILVDKQGRVMLADFGLAKNVAFGDEGEASAPTQSGMQNLTHAGAILGTPAYLAPEQARGEAVDFRADMYSLGVTLYESLAGQPPFTGETAAALLRQHVNEAPIAPRVLKPSLRPTVESLVMRLLDKRPDARFASYAELRAAIAAARAKELVPATFFVRGVALAVDSRRPRRLRARAPRAHEERDRRVARAVAQLRCARARVVHAGQEAHAPSRGRPEGRPDVVGRDADALGPPRLRADRDRDRVGSLRRSRPLCITTLGWRTRRAHDARLARRARARSRRPPAPRPDLEDARSFCVARVSSTHERSHQVRVLP